MFSYIRRLGPFWVKTFEFQYFFFFGGGGGRRGVKNNEKKFLWIILGGHHITGLFFGVISMHFSIDYSYDQCTE